MRGRKPRKIRKIHTVCDIAVAVMVSSSRILSISGCPCPSLGEWLSSSRPSDAEFGLGCRSCSGVCSIDEVIILSWLCDLGHVGYEGNLFLDFV